MSLTLDAFAILFEVAIKNVADPISKISLSVCYSLHFNIIVFSMGLYLLILT